MPAKDVVRAVQIVELAGGSSYVNISRRKHDKLPIGCDLSIQKSWGGVPRDYVTRWLAVRSLLSSPPSH